MSEINCKPLRVLIVEDSEDDTRLEVRELQRGGFEPAFEQVETMSDFTSALDRQAWDLVISDHSMPAFGSLQALELLKQKDADIPFIIVSGTIGEDIAVKAMKAGANDYVLKDQLGRLVPSVERELREASSRRSRRLAEDASRRSEEELNDFFEHASVGLYCAGPDGRILRANSAELELLGYASDEFVGHFTSEFYADSGKAADVLRRLHRGEELHDHEVRLRCKNGAIKDVLINANVRWEDGKFMHSRCFTRDITERKQGEKAAAYLAAIVASSDDAIIGNTLEGVVLTWNAAAERMYGYSANEIKGRSISVLIPHYRPEEIAMTYAQISEGKSMERYEAMRLKKDGTAIEVSVALSPIKDSKGAVIGVSAIERDITERKQEEKERVKLIDELTVALAKIKTLRGLLPICASCKKIRDDRGYWKKIEFYISEHTGAEFTHGICPDCMTQLYPQYTLRKMITETRRSNAESE